MDYYALWAKADGLTGTYPLLAHMLDSAAVARVLFRKWLRPGLQQKFLAGFGSEADTHVGLVVGLHDLGKAAPYFQHQPQRNEGHWAGIRETLIRAGFALGPKDRRIFGASPETKRHELLSMLALNLDITPGGEAAGSWLQMAIAAHHGRFKNPFQASQGLRLIRKIHNRFTDAEWANAHHYLQRQLEQALDVKVQDLPSKIDPTTLVLLSGLMVLADRIASNSQWVEKAQKSIAAGELSLDDPKKWLAIREADAVERVRQSVGLFQNWPDLENAQTAILGGYPPRPLQQEAIQVGDGLWNVMAPTGTGKTEAALLRHAVRNERLIFLLPTQATTNAIMGRVQKTFSETSNVAALAHSLAVTEDFYDQPIESNKVHLDDDRYQDTGGLYPTEFVKSGASRLLAPVCVGTVDQALLGALPTKFNHLRLLALANAHVVVDEVHTMDQFQSELMKTLIQWWAATETSVTFLTATMPKWQRDIFQGEYLPGITTDKATFPSLELWNDGVSTVTDLIAKPYHIGIELDEVPYDELIAAHIAWVREQRNRYPNARIGVICNTVPRAQQIAQALIDEAPVLLHSRMSAEHRRRNAEALEAAIGKHGKAGQCLVIGTQAIEASLDIDLDLLRTELCPAPSLIQRAGRLWRRTDVNRADRVLHSDTKTISVAAIEEADAWQTLPYTYTHIERVRNWLKTHDGIDFPEEIQDFIDSTALSSNELFALVTANDDVLEELAQDMLAVNKARALRINLQEALVPTAQNSDIVQITGEYAGNELTTRLIEADTKAVVLCDTTGAVPGAWTGSVNELVKLRGGNREQLRKALRASINVPVTKNFEGLLAQTESLEASKSVLARYVALPAAHQFYDELIGLVPETGK